MLKLLYRAAAGILPKRRYGSEKRLWSFHELILIPTTKPHNYYDPFIDIAIWLATDLSKYNTAA